MIWTEKKGETIANHPLSLYWRRWRPIRFSIRFGYEAQSLQSLPRPRYAEYQQLARPADLVVRVYVCFAEHESSLFEDPAARAILAIHPSFYMVEANATFIS